MKTILICGYRSSDHNEEPIGLSRDAEGLTLIDRRIRQLRMLTGDVVCVLSGSAADAQLRECSEIAQTELVFDANDPHVSLTTNVKAGLTAIPGEACFILPVEVPCPNREGWNFLKNAWLQTGMPSKDSCLLQACTLEGAPWHFGFPLIVTRFGNEVIRSLPNLKSLVDTRLKYLRLTYAGQPDLASSQKAA